MKKNAFGYCARIQRKKYDLNKNRKWASSQRQQQKKQRERPADRELFKEICVYKSL